MGNFLKQTSAALNLGRDIAKITGQDVRDDIAQRQAQAQAAATREAAEASAKASREAAAQATRQMELAAARQAAESARDAANDVPAENPDVLLTNPVTASPAAARKRRSQFGTGYSAGVSI